MYEISLNDARVILTPKNNLEKVYFELSSRCNFNCKMCFRNGFKTEFTDMDFEIFKKAMKELDVFPVKDIIFGGIGEPLLNKHFKEMVDMVKRKRYRLTIESNGSLIDEDMVNFMIDENVDELVLSAETGSEGHGFGGKTIKVIEMIKNKTKKSIVKKPVLTIQSILTKENVKGIKRKIDTLIEKGVSRFILSNLIPTSSNEVDLPLYMSNNEIELGLDRTVNITYPNFLLKTERYCNFVQKNSLVIRADGEVSPCYRFLHSYTEYVFGLKKNVLSVSFGNILKESVEKIWKSREFTVFRFKVKTSLYPSCTDCHMRNNCAFVENSEYDCLGNSPSCGDCLWWRNLTICP